MEPEKNKRIGHATGLSTPVGEQVRSSILPIFLFMLSVVIILGCVSILPRAAQPEQALATLQPSAVLTATQLAPVTTTFQPSPIPVTQTEESECTRLNLTSEECASLGQHLFTLSGVVDGYCWYGTDDKTVTRDLLVTVSFSNDGSRKEVTITNAAHTKCTATSTSDNTYTYDCIYVSNRNTGTITFVDNGFLNEGGFTNSVNKNCTWSESYELP